MDYKYSLFVSYPHVIDKPFVEVKYGWVTYLINQLKRTMDINIGRSDNVNLWYDKKELRGNDNIATTIETALNESATILIILSKAYLASYWCKKEMATFISQQDLSNRIFVVEYDKIKKIPPYLADLRRYEFWVEIEDSGKTKTLGIPKPDPQNEVLYYHKVNELSSDISEQILLMKNNSSNRNKLSNRKNNSILSENQETTNRIDNRQNRPKADKITPIIFLDKPPFRYKNICKKLKSYLESRGFNVIPNIKLDPKIENKYFLKCDLFIQLLDCYPDPEEKKWAKDKYNLATENNAKIIQWRDPKKDIHSILDTKYKNFLNSDTVRATGLQEFVNQVIQIIRDILPEFSNQIRYRKDNKLVSVISTKECTCMNNFCHELFHHPKVKNQSQPPEKFKDILVLSHGKTAKALINKYRNFQILDGQHLPTIIKKVADEVDNV